MKKEEFMRSAIADAKKNKHHFGAVVVKGNKIISKAGKRPVGDPRYHAESQAIIKATNKLKTRDLKGCILYSTCEPCPRGYHRARLFFGSEDLKWAIVARRVLDTANKQRNEGILARIGGLEGKTDEQLAQISIDYSFEDISVQAVERIRDKECLRKVYSLGIGYPVGKVAKNRFYEIVEQERKKRGFLTNLVYLFNRSPMEDRL